MKDQKTDRRRCRNRLVRIDWGNQGFIVFEKLGEWGNVFSAQGRQIFKQVQVNGGKLVNNFYYGGVFRLFVLDINWKNQRSAIKENLPAKRRLRVLLKICVYKTSTIISENTSFRFLRPDRSNPIGCSCGSLRMQIRLRI